MAKKSITVIIGLVGVLVLCIFSRMFVFFADSDDISPIPPNQDNLKEPNAANQTLAGKVLFDLKADMLLANAFKSTDIDIVWDSDEIYALINQVGQVVLAHQLQNSDRLEEVLPTIIAQIYPSISKSRHLDESEKVKLAALITESLKESARELVEDGDSKLTKTIDLIKTESMAQWDQMNLPKEAKEKGMDIISKS